MMGIKYTTATKKYFKKLQKKDKALLEKMSMGVAEIKENPYESGIQKKGDLSGIYGYDIFHKGSNYEIAYKIDVDDDGNVVLILLAGSRENFYEQLKRYIK